MVRHVGLFTTLKNYSLPGSSCPWDFPGKVLAWVAISCSRGSAHPGMKSTSLALAGGFFIIEPPGKPVVIFSPKQNLLKLPFEYVLVFYNTLYIVSSVYFVVLFPKALFSIVF